MGRSVAIALRFIPGHLKRRAERPLSWTAIRCIGG